MIQVTGCDDAEKLIHVLGYKFENGCSKTDASLITADAERAFLTVDSGFPLTKLEQSLQEGTPFAYAYPATRVPDSVYRKRLGVAAPAKAADRGNTARYPAERPGCGPALFGDVADRPGNQARPVSVAGAAQAASVSPRFSIFMEAGSAFAPGSDVARRRGC